MSFDSTQKMSWRSFLLMIIFYLSIFALDKHLISPAAFVLGSIVIFVRYFTAFHQQIHARRRGYDFFRIGEHIMIVVSPLMMGYEAYRRNHLAHHLYLDSSQDPDRYLTHAKPYTILFLAFFEPEIAFFSYLKIHGISWRDIFSTLGHWLIYGSIFALVSWETFVIYNLGIRIASSFTWFVFAWLIHREDYFRERTPLLNMPVLMQKLWKVLFGYDCYLATTHHKLHHTLAWIPDRHLKEFS